MKELTVFLNGNMIHNKDIIPYEQTQYQPELKFDIPANKFYTIIMVDKDAPRPDNPIYRYVLHWLIINNNETIMELKLPTPPINSGLHRYFIHLFEQQNKIKIEPIKERINFDLDFFIKKYMLKPIASNMFMTERK